MRLSLIDMMKSLICYFAGQYFASCCGFNGACRLVCNKKNDGD
jgi:hypothetical protein